MSLQHAPRRHLLLRPGSPRRAALSHDIIPLPTAPPAPLAILVPTARPAFIHWPPVAVAAAAALLLLLGLTATAAAFRRPVATPTQPPAVEPLAVAKVQPEPGPELVIPGPVAVAVPTVVPEAPEPSRELVVKEEPPPAASSVAQHAGRCGTAVAFADSPREAARLAARDDKLLFVLHVSGNFEDPQFT